MLHFVWWYPIKNKQAGNEAEKYNTQFENGLSWNLPIKDSDDRTINKNFKSYYIPYAQATRRPSLLSRHEIYK